MPRTRVAADGAAFEGLREALGRLSERAAGPEVDLIELAKAYADLAVAMEEVAARAGHTSLRFRAAARALDLKTPKSALVGFVEEG